MLIVDIVVYGLLSIIVVGKSYSKVGLKHLHPHSREVSSAKILNDADLGSIAESHTSYANTDKETGGGHGPGSGSSSSTPSVSLRVLNVSKNHFSREGTITVLNSVNAELLTGRVTCLLGSNGAGKVSFFMSIYI